jgi:hypothetical protein
MVEYFYDYIKTTANEESVVCAFIEETDGTAITSNCDFTLYDNFGNMLFEVQGVYSEELGYWMFAVPAIEEPGRYYYTIGNNGVELVFKTPFYVA